MLFLLLHFFDPWQKSLLCTVLNFFVREPFIFWILIPPRTQRLIIWKLPRLSYHWENIDFVNLILLLIFLILEDWFWLVWVFDDFLHLENVHLISEHVQLILDFMLIETPFEAINILNLSEALLIVCKLSNPFILFLNVCFIDCRDILCLRLISFLVMSDSFGLALLGSECLVLP